MSISARSIALLGFALASAVGGMVWWTFALSVAPFAALERKDREESASLQQRLESARRTIKEIQGLETDTIRERRALLALESERPPGSALVWFPERVKQHFARYGAAGAVARLNTALDDKELPGFERAYWAVELPAGNTSQEIRAACLAIAEFESLDPFTHVLDVATRPDADDPTRRVLVVNVSVLSRKARTSRA